jgi:hypothetical protein
VRYFDPVAPDWENAVFERSLGVIILGAALSGCGGGSAPPVKSDLVPDNIKPPPGYLLTLQSHAKGVQIYLCKETAPDKFEWTLKAPEATLVDQAGNKVARHFAGPTWQGSDGSEVVGEVVSRADSPEHSIPWLLLRAKSNVGKGRFGAVKYIQRLHTTGGTAPPSCKSKEQDDDLKVNYTADYFFYVESR